MKKLLFAAALFLSLGVASAQEGRTPDADKVPAGQGQVPAMIVDRFNREYPGISGNWSKDGENYRVEFVDPQSHLGHIIVYDRNGEVLRRESELDGPSNPNAINSFYQSNYPGEQIKTWSVVEKDGTMSYYGTRNKEILKFDKDGKPAPKAATNQKPAPPKQARQQ